VIPENGTPMAENEAQGTQSTGTTGTTGTGQQQSDSAGETQSTKAPTAEDLARTLGALNAERDGHEATKRAKQVAETERETARTNLGTVTTERDDFKGKFEALNTAVPTLRERATLADRYEAAHAAGLDLSWAPRLQGAKKEEWEADAKKLVETLGASTAGRRRPPAPDRSQGNSGSGSTKPSSVTAAMDLIRAERAGTKQQ
jgi:hypothetical protein